MNFLRTNLHIKVREDVYTWCYRKLNIQKSYCDKSNVLSCIHYFIRGLLTELQIAASAEFASKFIVKLFLNQRQHNGKNNKLFKDVPMSLSPGPGGNTSGFSLPGPSRRFGLSACNSCPV